MASFWKVAEANVAKLVPNAKHIADAHCGHNMIIDQPHLVTTGRTVEESYRDLLITAGKWQEFMEDLQQTLDEFEVPAAEQAEVNALVESTRRPRQVGKFQRGMRE